MQAAKVSAVLDHFGVPTRGRGWGLSGAVITWREKGWAGSYLAGSLQSTVTPSEEVRPMNAVSMWVLPLPSRSGD
jgi:hypothetical protein